MITQKKKKQFGFSPGAWVAGTTKGAGLFSFSTAFSSGAGAVFSTVIADPISFFGFIFEDMFSSLFGKPVQCTDPFTGKLITGKAGCMAAEWRARCSDPKFFDPKICGDELYDPQRINCPKGSTATGKNQYGVPIGACVCDIGIDYRESRKLGCRLNPIRTWWPVGAAAIGLLFLVSKS